MYWKVPHPAPHCCVLRLACGLDTSKNAGINRPSHGVATVFDILHPKRPEASLVFEELPEMQSPSLMSNELLAKVESTIPPALILKYPTSPYRKSTAMAVPAIGSAGEKVPLRTPVDGFPVIPPGAIAGVPV